MKIALCSSFVPFVFGGARLIVEWLETKLLEHGHAVERVYLPFVEAPDRLLAQMTAYRLLDLTEAADRVIAFRPPAHVIPHPDKVLWFIHHIRVFYDLWDSPYRPVPDAPPGRALRDRLMAADGVALREAKRVFTNSRVVSERLRRFNGVGSEVLYPPVFDPGRFHSPGRDEDYGDEIVYVCRVEHHKRQHLLVEAMAHVRSPVRLRLCGSAGNPAYADNLRARVAALGLGDRVRFEDRWISEAEKAAALSTALAAAYLPLDEDSYGYPSLEASHARKPILTTTDSGGVTELVEDGLNGLVCDPDPRALAEAMDRLHRERARTRDMGHAAERRVGELGITWDRVLERLTAP